MQVASQEGWQRRRGYGGPLRRFDAPVPHMQREQARLGNKHPAVSEARTVFPSTVVEAAAAPRLLVSGANNPKLGRKVAKGPWRGMPIYHLTLEERATCPRSCAVWQECMGNSMHLARRHAHGAELEFLLGAELMALAEAHPGGFAIRLHTLGDFYSLRYAARWAVWLRWIPQLHIFGFTANGPQTAIGRLVGRMNEHFPDRCGVRFSRPAPRGGVMEAATIWAGVPLPRAGVVCPAQTGRTECCATCALCWSPAAAGKAILFLGHGMRHRSGRRVGMGVAG